MIWIRVQHEEQSLGWWKKGASQKKGREPLILLSLLVIRFFGNHPPHPTTLTDSHGRFGTTCNIPKRRAHFPRFDTSSTSDLDQSMKPPQPLSLLPPLHTQTDKKKLQTWIFGNQEGQQNQGCFCSSLCGRWVLWGQGGWGHPPSCCFHSCHLCWAVLMCAVGTLFPCPPSACFCVRSVLLSGWWGGQSHVHTCAPVPMQVLVCSCVCAPPPIPQVILATQVNMCHILSCLELKPVQLKKKAYPKLPRVEVSAIWSCVLAVA